ITKHLPERFILINQILGCKLLIAGSQFQPLIRIVKVCVLGVFFVL
ncbi:MAG: hypothetical protein FD167_2905, partial [bacterium]